MTNTESTARAKTFGSSPPADLKLLTLPGEGEQLGDMTIKVNAANVGNAFSAMQNTLVPRSMVPPHVHQHQWQAVYVISGELYFEVGGPDGIMIANLIREQFGRVNDWPMGATLAVCMMIIVALISVVYIWTTRKVTERIA